MIDGGGSNLGRSRLREFDVNHGLMVRRKGDRLHDENVITATDAIVVQLHSIVVGRQTEAFALLRCKHLAGKQFRTGHQQQ